MNFEIRKIGDFIKQRKEFITISDSVEYKRCRVQVQRKGVLLRDIVKGLEINTKKQQVCKAGDFIVAEIDAKVGGYGFIPEELEGAIVSSHYYLFEIDTKLFLPQYLNMLVKTDVIQNQINAKGSTNYSAIRPSDVLNFQIPYTDLINQKKLIETFVKTEDKNLAILKELHHQSILINQLRQSILQEAVQGKLVPQNPKDEPASVLLEKIKKEKAKLIAEGKLKKEKELPPIGKEEIPFELPKGWLWCRLGEITINRDGERKPISSDERQFRKGEYDYYGASGIIDKIDGYLFDKDLLLVGEDGANLVTRSTPIAFFAKGKYWVNNHAHVLDAISHLILRYLEVFINAIDLKPYVTGTAQPKMNQAKMNSIVICFPPFPEQQRIVLKVEELLQTCDALEKEVESQKEIVKVLMQTVLREAFEGGISTAEKDGTNKTSGEETDVLMAAEQKQAYKKQKRNAPIS